MTTPLALRRVLTRDVVLRGHTPLLRIALVQSTASCVAAAARFGVDNPRAASLFARHLTASALLSAFLKGEERSILRYAGAPGDPIAQMYGETVAVGEVRGSAVGAALSRSGAAAGEHASWDGRLARSGNLSVTRVLYGAATPWTSTSSVSVGDVEGDLAEYFRTSEQVPAVVHLEARVDDASGRIMYAGGVLVQSIATGGGVAPVAQEGGPAATSLEDVSRVLRAGPGSEAHLLADEHARGVPLHEVAGLIVHELRRAHVVTAGSSSLPEGGASSPVLERWPLDYFCRCTKHRFLDKLLRTVPPPELDAWCSEAGDAPDAIAATLVCEYCNARHEVSRSELAQQRAAMAGEAAAAAAAGA